MLHLAYFGVGLLCLLGAAVGPALLSYLIEVFLWWINGKKASKTPRLTEDYGAGWFTGFLVLVAGGGAYGVGYLIIRFILKY